MCRETEILNYFRAFSAGIVVCNLLPPSTFDLTFAAPLSGFSTDCPEGVVLRVGGMFDLTLKLRIVTTETITVVSDLPPTLNTGDVKSSQRIREDRVYGLPSDGRNFLNMALLTPGESISQGPDGSQLNVSGQRGTFKNSIIDGANCNNSFFDEQRGGQRPTFTFNQDDIEELVVINQAATAEFGRPASGFVTVITKSGTNKLAGTTHYLGQWDDIAAPFPEVGCGRRPGFDRNLIGGTLGSPLVNDRAFFFSPTTSRAVARQSGRSVT